MSSPAAARSRPAALAGCVLLLQLGLAGAWILADRTPPYWDEAWYMYQGLRQYDALRQGGLPAWYSVWTGLDRTRPSLVPTLTIPAIAAFGASPQACLLVNLVALAVLLLAVYRLGSALGGQRTGLLAMLAAGAYPLSIGLAHILLVEMVMIALVAVELLALWQADGFRRDGWSLLTGLALGLGLLTKVFFPVFILGPWLVTALAAVRPAGKGWTRPTERQVTNLALALLLAAGLAALWYLPNLATTVSRSADAAVGAEAAPYGPANPLQWHNLLAYLFNFIGTGTSLVGFLLLLAGAVALAWTRGRASGEQPGYGCRFLGSSALLSYLVFTSLRNQDIKQISGILPALALLTGWGLSRLPARLPAAAVTGTAAAVMVFGAVIGTFPGPLATWQPQADILGTRLLLVYPAQPWTADTRYAAPDPAAWPLDQILDYAVDAADLESLPRDQVHLALIPDDPGFEQFAFLFESYRRSIPVALTAAQPANLSDQDILIDRTGGRGFAPRAEMADQMRARLAGPDADFHLLPRSFQLPDGTQAILYARSSPLIPARPAPQYPAGAQFGKAVRFLGLDVQEGEPGANTLSLCYYWETLGPTDGDFKAFVHLVDPAGGAIVAQDDHPLFPRVYPSSTWQPGRFLYETRTVALPPSYAGSALTVRVGLYRDEIRLPVTSSGGQAATFADVAGVSLSR